MVLGYKGVVGLLAGATVTGFLMAIFMANAGGAWDNAKKYIEAGNFGGKGGDCHKAAVVGDTVGDPFKDTSGPAINILIKLLSHGVHCVRWPDRELLHLLRSLGRCQAIENAEAPSRKAGRSGLLYCVKAVSLRRR